MKFEAQAACAKAEIDVKLRRAMLRKFSGRDEELQPGERCLYWRESPDRQHTIQWRGPATVLAVEKDPDNGTIVTYWLAHGTSLLRGGRQHVRRLPREEGLKNAEQKVKESLENLRQRRVVRVLDLTKVNKRSLDELDPEEDDEELLDPVLRQSNGPASTPATAGTPATDTSPPTEMTPTMAVAPPVHDHEPAQDTTPVSQLEIDRTHHNAAVSRTPRLS